MARAQENRSLIKNRRNDPDRLVLRKYDPIVRRHVDFKEDR